MPEFVQEIRYKKGIPLKSSKFQQFCNKNLPGKRKKRLVQSNHLAKTTGNVFVLVTIGLECLSNKPPPQCCMYVRKYKSN